MIVADLSIGVRGRLQQDSPLALGHAVRRRHLLSRLASAESARGQDGQERAAHHDACNRRWRQRRVHDSGRRRWCGHLRRGGLAGCQLGRLCDRAVPLSQAVVASPWPLVVCKEWEHVSQWEGAHKILVY